MHQLPQHLQKYIVEQDPQNYTAQDHAVWRYIMRQLKNYLKIHAHESYLDGLEKTGISIDEIPRISDISRQLEKFGWRALPVSGFIPPAAFMELQSLSVLPIASDMRSIDHLQYTPAPDIVHEAAGHAPILANAEYAEYLKQYAQVAKKAVISKEDLELYRAIRELSDIKENPASTPYEVAAAEKKLTEVSQSMTYVSEAAELSRMNWWTAEYGLVGDINQPKIFGAGLLSSVGESKWCLSQAVKKIPLSVDCVKQSYDITEPQPQLFVAESFKHLGKVLSEFARTMAYQTGGEVGLKKILQAQTVNTVEFDNGLQISGQLTRYLTDSEGRISYLQFSGPSQLCLNGSEIKGHGKYTHNLGYGCPVGRILNPPALTDLNKNIEIKLNTGIRVRGDLKVINKLAPGAELYSFENAVCTNDTETLFKPEWGTFDILCAENITSVFGGPADRKSYGEIEDFVAARVQKKSYSAAQLKLFSLYEELRNIRAKKKVLSDDEILQLLKIISDSAPSEWLLYLELYELSLHASTEVTTQITSQLNRLKKINRQNDENITEGLKLIHEKN